MEVNRKGEGERMRIGTAKKRIRERKRVKKKRT